MSAPASSEQPRRTPPKLGSWAAAPRDSGRSLTLPSPVLGAAQQGAGSPVGQGMHSGRHPELSIVPGSRELGPAALPLSLGQPEADWHQAGG